MFAKRLKELRIDAGLKQSELAKKLDISPSTIGMYEQGRRSADQETLLKISDFFNVSTDYLLGKSNEREINEFIEKLDSPKDIKNMLKIFTELSEEAQDRMLSIAKVFLEEEKLKK
ncbi:helix-turn-helix transcriptional regulator [Clostridioides difficile]|uniref:helix-turn-helix domain-containing protein n=1 Tax=unclassified Clostridioides TaxID=2635829 RepID=UPI0016B6304D|nr:helix-turn-helix transcriptional regulator [Clostridioides difficile]NJI80425.1 helix-turn-helix transcriptional regulator [Clostridioides difficile]